jgi:hypothetical protein
MPVAKDGVAVCLSQQVYQYFADEILSRGGQECQIDEVPCCRVISDRGEIDGSYCITVREPDIAE